MQQYDVIFIPNNKSNINTINDIKLFNFKILKTTQNLRFAEVSVPFLVVDELVGHVTYHSTQEESENDHEG